MTTNCKFKNLQLIELLENLIKENLKKKSFLNPIYTRCELSGIGGDGLNFPM